MKFFKWLDKQFWLVLAIASAVGFIIGMVYAHYSIDSIEKRHKAAVAAGVFERKAVVETVAVAIPVETAMPLYDIPLDDDLQYYIIDQSQANGIDPAIIFAMCYRESSYNANCIGDNCNSYGLMQIQPKWHIERMERLGCTDLLDPYDNITVGLDYLCELLNKYGDMAKALTAYNRGHYNGIVTQYAKNVLETASELNVITENKQPIFE